jgi:hypothetical protein
VSQEGGALCEVDFFQVVNAIQQFIPPPCSPSRSASLRTVFQQLVRDAVLAEAVHVVVAAWTIVPEVCKKRAVRTPLLYNR